MNKINYKFFSKSSLFIRFILFLTATIFLNACHYSPETTSLSDQFWKRASQNKILIAIVQTTKSILERGNEEGFLGHFINNSVNSNFENYLKKIDLTWYKKQLPKNFQTQLKQHHIFAAQYKKFITPNLNPEDDLNILQQTHSRQLLRIKLEAIGAKRIYRGVTPLESPQAYCVLTGELINKNHRVLWRYQATVTQMVKGEWDQPPQYDNLTNALKMAENAAMEELLDSFFSGQ